MGRGARCPGADAAAKPERAVAGFAYALRDPGAHLTLVRIARDGVLIEPK